MSLLKNNRVLSGMRPTGRLHLGHYYGVLANWTQLQHNYDCFFFVADWHALTTHYEQSADISAQVWDMVVDWLAAGVAPSSATLFIQSQVPEHAELHLLLSMSTPLSWLERVPSYKDQQAKLRDRDLDTYGFLGYPLLQSADILIYQAGRVPVGEDQVSHVELTREIARRFNHLYGRDPDFEARAEKGIDKMGKKNAKRYRQLRKAYQEQGDDEALQTARALVDQQHNLSVADRERLIGYLEGGGIIVLTEPQALLTETPKLPGLDGQKMSKSYGNTIAMREDPDVAAKKIRTMQTDPARVRRTDPGEPESCPVWQWHCCFSDQNTRDWVQQGCRSAGIGCLDCKQPLVDKVVHDIRQLNEAAKPFEEQPELVRELIEEGNEKARETARDTMDLVRERMHLNH